VIQKERKIIKSGPTKSDLVKALLERKLVKFSIAVPPSEVLPWEDAVLDIKVHSLATSDNEIQGTFTFTGCTGNGSAIAGIGKPVNGFYTLKSHTGWIDIEK